MNTYEGVNALIYEENHDYLRDLQVQKKKRYYPTNAESSSEFGNILFPSTNFLRNTMYKTEDVPKNDKSTPIHGNWAMRRSEPSLLDPAGCRKPKPFDTK